MDKSFLAVVPVLCSYSYRAAFPYDGETLYGSKMIFVASSQFIEKEFELAMQEERDEWQYMLSAGPKPLDWCLESYLPRNGLESF